MKYLLAFLFVLAGCKQSTEVVRIVDGLPGNDGVNGHSIVSEYMEASWCECDEKGGSRLDIYLDLDDSLTATEGDLYQNSIVVCNGERGLQGNPGQAGPMGLTGNIGPQGLPGIGLVGPMGPQGNPGVNATATIQNYSLNSSCQSIGDGFYAKKSGDEAKIYSNSSCSSLVVIIYAEHSSGGDASYWLTGTRLATNDNAGNLRVIKFN